MQKKKRSKVLLGSLKVMLASALLAAISIVCGKFLSFPQDGIFRFSVENLPILFAGMAFGPVSGMVTAVLADLLGCLMRGWAPLPWVTVGAGVLGLTGGLVYRVFPGNRLWLRVGSSVFFAHLLGSVLVKTINLYHTYRIPYPVALGWRGLNYLLVGAVEFVLLLLLFRNKAVTGQIQRLKQ